METKSSSITALRVAMRREAHQIMDDPKVFYCPLAFHILGAKNQSKQQLDPKIPGQNPSESRYRAYLAARSRYAEEEMHSAVKRRVQQYVVLVRGLTHLPAEIHTLIRKPGTYY